MQLGCIAAIGALYLMWMGGQGLYTSVKNRTPMELACENYDDVKPGREWLRLTGCELNVMESSYVEESGKAVELFIPARGPGEEERDPIYVLVATDDKELLTLTNEMMNLETESELMRYFARNRSKLHFKRDVEGLVRYGVDLDDSDRAELAGFDDALASDFVIVDDGKEPGFAKSLGFLGGGIMSLLGVGAIAAGSEDG
ncbi:MAG: hypothetical protein BMS9Abin37_1233 [Acidobacteriota bacterium]|nr:MAG: hypothetical protein BMS9Abin37_1233 [Acidobacteriota bacterium]